MITLFNVSKKFMLHPKGRDILFKSIVRTIKKQNTPKTIWALDNVSIDIKKGEVVGLIGSNGSGKTTLLKIICGIYKPSSGIVRLEGEVTPLLQLGVGFLPDLTVKDNVFLYGAIMGLDRKDIHKNFKRVIDFAGLGDFINVESRTLSLGMEERLAFSVIMQASGDIFLFDETFAVGDCSFKEKGLKVIEEFRKRKKTIVISSHDLNIVREFCDRVLLLHKGRVVAFGNAGEVIDKYINFSKEHKPD